MPTTEIKYAKKQAKQERSKRIIDAILEGATRVLSRSRMAEATTNRIAEVAGVGIGSLYDYFPNKTSIAVALMDRRLESVTEGFRELLAQNPGASLDEKIEEIVAYLYDDHLVRRDFLREIFYLAPSTGRMESLYQARIRGTAILAEFLSARRVVDAEVRAFVAMHSVMGLMDGFIMINPEFVSLDQMRVELRRVIRSSLSSYK